MLVKQNSKHSIKFINRYQQSPYEKNIQEKKSQQIENFNIKNKNIQIKKEFQFKDYQELLQYIEDLLEQNREKYQIDIANNLDLIITQYQNLQYLMNMMFFKRRQELEQKLIQAENENKQQKYIKEKQEDKNYQYQLTIDEKLEKIKNLEYEIKKKTQDINDQKYMIQKKEEQLKQKEDQIIDLNQNLKVLQITIKKNNEIFQQTIQEVKQMSSKAIIKLEIEKGWKVFKNADGKLKEIVKKEQDIKENTLQINQEVDELLILIKNNSNDQMQEEKRQSIMKKFQDVKNTIKSVREKLEEIIKKQSKAWGSARIADTEQMQSVKLNLEAMISYSKLFDHLFQVVTYLVEQSIEYQQQDSEVIKQQSSIALKITNNRNLTNNYSIVVNNIDSQNDRQLLYANIATQSFDTISMKDNNSQTDNEIPLNQEDIFVNSVTQSPTKNPYRQKWRNFSQLTSKFKTEQAN